MNVWITGMTLTLLAAGCWTDLRRMIIPNELTAGFAAAGFAFHAVTAGWTGMTGALVGGAAGVLPLLLLYRMRGIGAGDVKWFGAFGVWTGAAAALQLLMYSVLCAGGFSLLLLLLRVPGIRRFAQRIPWPWGQHPAIAAKGARFPFMLAVAPGFVWMIWSMGGRMF
jgi:prepilin peptidase CpaA